MLALAVVAGAGAKTKAVKTQPQLRFDPTIGETRTLTMPDGMEVKFTAYEGMFFVTNVEDSAYQTINVYVPDAERRGFNADTYSRNLCLGCCLPGAPQDRAFPEV